MFLFKLKGIALRKNVQWAFGALIVVCVLGFASRVYAQEQDDLFFGMSTALSGPAEHLGKNMLLGFRAGFERINRQGGIHGKALRIIALDDGYEPVRTVPNMNALIDEHQVLAVVGNVGTPTAIAAIPIANQKKTLLYAPFTGAGILRKTPPDRYVINFRASYAEETKVMIDSLMDILKLKPEEIAFFTQRDGYGDAGFSGGITALKKHGLTDQSKVLHVRYERNTLEVEEALADIILSGKTPKAIIMVGAYAPCAKFIQLSEEHGLKALFLNVSFVGSEPLAKQLDDTQAKVIVTQVVPHYASELPLVQEYQKDFKDLGFSETPSFGSLEGYVAARILTLALKNTEGDINRESIIDSLESLGTFELGLGGTCKLGPRSHQASDKIWPTVLRNGEFVPFDWKDLSNLLRQD